MKKDIQYRSITITKSRVNDEARTVEATLSSEEPCPRYGGNEILQHTANAIDLSRASNGLPLLFCHDPAKPIGIAEDVRVENKRLKARLRFGQSSQANEIWTDVKSGILRKVSIGYIYEDSSIIKQDDGSYRVTSWQLLEVSVVGVPADDTVGIGRSNLTGGNSAMKTEQPDPQLDDKVQAERERVMDINALFNMHKDRIANADRVREQMINDGSSVEKAQAYLLKAIKTHPVTTPIRSLASHDNFSLDMTDREISDYSVVRLIRAAVSNDYREAGLEMEASDAIARKINRKPDGFFVPIEAMQVRAPISTSTASELVGTDHLASEFIDLLRNRTQVVNAGARILSGLVGNVEIPRAAAAATAQWVAENSALTEGNADFSGQITLSPKTVGALTSFTRRMILQSSPDIEMLVRNDLIQVIARAIDLAAINGSGSSNEPRGILNTAGIGSVSIGTNGGAPTYEHIVSLETEVAASNADMGSLAYLTNSSVRGKLRVTEKAASTGMFVWEDLAQGNQMSPGQGRLNGYTALVSNQVPANLAKGSGTDLSAILFGNWSDLIIGQWGVLELVPNPYDSTEFPKGNVLVRAMQDVDVQVRHPESFSTIVDADPS